MNWLEAIPKFPGLAEGAHKPNSKQMCAMELVAFMERLPHSDHPQCTCPVLAAYVRRLNDRMPAIRRNELLPLLPRLVGTVGDIELQRKRAMHFAMVVVTDLVSIALDGRIAPASIAAMRGAVDLKTARAASYAANYAAYDAANVAADAAWAATNANTKHDFWAHAIRILEAAIEIGAPQPARWESARIREAIEALT